MRAFLLCAVTAAAAVTAGAVTGKVDYTRQVKPLLAERCYACHGGLQQLGGLRLDTGALVRKGSARGPIVVPGKPDASRLLHRVTAEKPPLRMPPEGEGEALTPEEVALLRAWIAQGAPSPADEKPEEDPKKHWSFQPVKRPAVPKVKNTKWVRNPIDAFILAEQEKRGLSPAPPASKEVLLRRVTLDLTGLPPTREELHAFLADRSPEAYEKVVDRLLASPRYGERWGRHWMDIWRYSDWYGRRLQTDVRNSYGQVWRWRDWIIESLNAGKPYSRMVVEMLAADEVAPADEKALAATGFLVRNWYSLNYSQWMRDNVEHTGKAFLGLTFNCAHCHDHKYDPISQEDYFRFRAFFEPLELRHDRWPGDADPGPFKKYVYGGSTAPLKSGMIRVFDERPDAKTYLYKRGDERERFPGEPTVEPGAPEILGGSRLKIAPVALPAEASYPGLKAFIRQEETARCEQAVTAAKSVTPADPLRVAAAESELAALQARIRADDARHGKAANAEELARAASKAERQAVLHAAEYALAGAKAKAASAPADLKAQEALKQAEAKAAAARTAAAGDAGTFTRLTPVYPEKSTGRRRALAEWIASAENPLTARVAVNHVWARHFGRPLVETVFDFGRNGKRPTHPELLDYLASRFAAPQSPESKVLSPATRTLKTGDSGPRAQDPGLDWSLKRLHRLIVTSATYWQAGETHSPPAAANPKSKIQNPKSDPRFYIHFPARRVEAEVVRDSILHAAGTLDLTMGGPELDNTKEETRRRSLYYSVYAEDGGSMRFLATFDAPNTCDAYRRSESILPQQALALANSRITLDQGRVLARKLWEAVPGGAAEAREAAFITAAFEQLLTRRPTAEELAACREYLWEQEALFRAAGAPAAGPGVAPSTDPLIRAGESLVQALFNHNEFLMIR